MNASRNGTLLVLTAAILVSGCSSLPDASEWQGTYQGTLALNRLDPGGVLTQIDLDNASVTLAAVTPNINFARNSNSLLWIKECPTPVAFKANASFVGETRSLCFWDAVAGEPVVLLNLAQLSGQVVGTHLQIASTVDGLVETSAPPTLANFPDAGGDPTTLQRAQYSLSFEGDR